MADAKGLRAIGFALSAVVAVVSVVAAMLVADAAQTARQNALITTYAAQ